MVGSGDKPVCLTEFVTVSIVSGIITYQDQVSLHIFGCSGISFSTLVRIMLWLSDSVWSPIEWGDPK